MELLERLAQQKNCAYISDLRFLPKSDRHFPQLSDVDITDYSDWEWKDGKRQFKQRLAREECLCQTIRV